MRKTMLLLLPLALSGCQTWEPTWSEVSGSRYTHIDMNRTATMVQEIDGQTAIPLVGRYRTVRVDPGKHVVTLKAFPLHSAEIRFADIDRVTLELEPCKRYYVNAQFDNPTAQTWKLVIDYVEPIAGCSTNVAAK